MGYLWILFIKKAKIHETEMSSDPTSFSVLVFVDKSFAKLYE
jgi:hypothetical protein